MAEFTIPLAEAIRVFSASVQLPVVVRRIEAAPQGPRVMLRLSPLMREFGVVIRFARFENGTALFLLDGLPELINLNTLLKPPAGIVFDSGRMAIRPAALLEHLGVRGVNVTGFSFENGVYRVFLSA
jgi:hypothetical protein